jgi:cytoskeletal protein CcmA (bactofilin family)
MWRWKWNGSGPDQTAMSIIDHGCDLSGHLDFIGTLVVNGKFQGELSSSDTLIIGETAELQANIQAGTVIVNGQITGNIMARDRVELHGSARVFGDIETPVLVLEAGVFFDGNCRMNGQELRVVERNPLKQKGHG